MQFGPHFLSRADNNLAQLLAKGISEGQMPNHPFTKKSRWALPSGAVKYLIGHHHFPRFNLLAHNPAGAHRQHMRYTELFERVNIGPGRHFAR